MKNKIAYIFVVLFWLIASSCLAQDTFYIMIRTKEIVEFDHSTMHITDRYPNKNGFEIKLNAGDMLMLHLYDKEKMFRDVIVKSNDSLIYRKTYNSKSRLIYWPTYNFPCIIRISKPRKNK